MTSVGDVLASKYRLEELLGSGGMGHVFRATNELVGRAVAIKVLRSEHATNAPMVERFMREARAANLVRHPNVVDVLDVGRDGDGAPFIVQELLHGQDLSKYVQKRGGRLDLAEIEEYFLPVVEAVAEAHARGVVHRDIKPENVFLADEGRRRVPKLLDFGISKIRLPNVRTTEVGVMMGTPAYMAPEQIQGGSEADPRSDVWALGVMLFELLAGRLPFDIEDAPALFVAIVTRDVPTLAEVSPDVHPDVSRVVERCLRRNRDDRYGSALELARDLRHVLAGTEIEPTDRMLPVAASALDVPDLAIPDLILPAKRALLPANRAVAAAPGGTQLAGSSGASELALDRNQIEARSPAPPSSSFDLELDDGARAATLADARRPFDESPVTFAAASSTTAPEGGGRIAEGGAAMSGVMMAPAGHAPSARRPPPASNLSGSRSAAPAGPDMSLLIGLAVVGLTAIGATAVLMTFAHQPDGLPLVSFVTKPTPTLNLVVHGGLAVVGFILTARFAAAGVRRWRDGGEGRGGAVFLAVVSGAFFFGAIELARAAF